MVEKISRKILKEVLKVGFEISKEKAGNFLLVDDEVVIKEINDIFRNQVEVLTIKDAKRKYGIKVGKNVDGGVFIRIPKNATIMFPFQACFLMKDFDEQRVFNCIVIEEGANANILSGCTSMKASVLHVGATKIIVGKNAKLHYTMIHNWRKDMRAFPAANIVAKEGSKVTHNYVHLGEGETRAVVHARCNNANMSFNSIVSSRKEAKVEISDVASLSSSSAEIIARVVARDHSRVKVRSRIEGFSRSKGHVECRGLLMDNAKMESVPELLACGEGNELTHEAAIGKIAEKELLYLMSRGFSEKEATSLIVKGFLDVNLLGLPERISKGIEKIIEKSGAFM